MEAKVSTKGRNSLFIHRHGEEVAQLSMDHHKVTGDYHQ